jgi:hypothetical protein
MIFWAGFLPLWGVIVAHVRSRDPEMREDGLILPENGRQPFVPWSDVLYCESVNRGRKLLIQRLDGDVVIRTDPTQVETAWTVLFPRVRVRDEMGKVLNSDLNRLYVDLPWDRDSDRYQFRLRTLLLLLVVASSAFAWLGIHLHSRRDLAKQEAVLAKYERFQPGIMRSGNSVTLLDFSQCKASPGDADLVYLKDLPDLQFLNLTNARITDAGLVHLESLKQLDYVVLTGTQVTEDGVRKLRESLPNTKIVREPHLPFLNGVTPEPRTKRPSGVR